MTSARSLRRPPQFRQISTSIWNVRFIGSEWHGVARPASTLGRELRVAPQSFNTYPLMRADAVEPATTDSLAQDFVFGSPT
jgi:hypothetical protein